MPFRDSCGFDPFTVNRNVPLQDNFERGSWRQLYVVAVAEHGDSHSDGCANTGSDPSATTGAAREASGQCTALGCGNCNLRGLLPFIAVSANGAFFVLYFGFVHVGRVLDRSG